MTCKNGKNLERCEEFNCPPGTYKCPFSYCIKLRYLCDGFWDCTKGVDEKTCSITNHAGFYKCRNTSIIISPASVCDNTIDCPLDDDEVACSISRVECPYDCFKH